MLKKVFLIIALCFTVALSLPFTARCEASNAAEQLAKTFSRYDSIGKYASNVPAAPDRMAQLIQLACNSNIDVVYCWIDEFPKSRAYIVHITWDKFLPFQKNSYVVVKLLDYYHGTSIEHTRMNKELKENRKKWWDAEFPPREGGLTEEESREFWRMNKKSD